MKWMPFSEGSFVSAGQTESTSVGQGGFESIIKRKGGMDHSLSYALFMTAITA